MKVIQSFTMMNVNNMMQVLFMDNDSDIYDFMKDGKYLNNMFLCIAV